ncbi:MAG: hypothetical protein WDN06_08075 [Asticcacaulis sp.]
MRAGMANRCAAKQKLLRETRKTCGKCDENAAEPDYLTKIPDLKDKFHLQIGRKRLNSGKFFHFSFAIAQDFRLYGYTTRCFGAIEESDTMAKAIAITQNRMQELIALSYAFVASVLIIDLVSLLIGGVLRPLHLEW